MMLDQGPVDGVQHLLGLALLEQELADLVPPANGHGMISKTYNTAHGHVRTREGHERKAAQLRNRP